MFVYTNHTGLKIDLFTGGIHDSISYLYGDKSGLTFCGSTKLLIFDAGNN
jgi:hypothetical protein